MKQAVRTKLVTRKVLEDSLDNTFETVGKFLGTHIKPLIEALEKRIAELEARPVGLEYVGIWREGTYEKNQCVTFGGSLWIALCNTPMKPGTDSSWQLCVKRGRDGKDAKS